MANTEHEATQTDGFTTPRAPEHDVMIARSQRLTPSDRLGPVKDLGRWSKHRCLDLATGRLRPWEPGDPFASRRLAIVQSIPGTILLMVALIVAAVLVSGVAA